MPTASSSSSGPGADRWRGPGYGRSRVATPGGASGAGGRRGSAASCRAADRLAGAGDGIGVGATGVAAGLGAAGSAPGSGTTVGAGTAGAMIGDGMTGWPLTGGGVAGLTIVVGAG